MNFTLNSLKKLKQGIHRIQARQVSNGNEYIRIYQSKINILKYEY